MLKVRLFGKGLLFLPFYLIQQEQRLLATLPHTSVDTKSSTHQLKAKKKGVYVNIVGNSYNLLSVSNGLSNLHALPHLVLRS